MEILPRPHTEPDWWAGYRVGWTRLLLSLLLTLSLLGCDRGGEGTVEVDVGQAPLAAAYRVDLYAQEGGPEPIEGQGIVEGTEVKFEEVPAGRWSVLIQAQNGDNTTIGHYIEQIVVKADEVTRLKAGTYRPGLPGDPLPESENSLASFGPDGRALLTAIYAPGVESLPPATVTLTIENGPGEVQVVDEGPSTLARASAREVQGCATAWLAAQEEKQQAPSVLSQASPAPTTPRADYGSLAPGETASVFVATTFREVVVARVLSDEQTENCVILAEVVDGTPVIDDVTALEIAHAFDLDNPFIEGDAGIYEDTRSRFGSEWITNPVGGIDGDERVILTFLSSDSIGSAGFFGFFRPQDERPQDEVSTSNVAEILFLNADRANDDLYDVLVTISHELVHLILFNEKQGQDGTFPEGALQENIVIDEGLAVLNEDLSGFGFSGAQGGNFFLLASVDALLEEGLNRPFFQFMGSFDDYGAGYLLSRYLYDRFGQETLREITTSPAVGRNNIAAVLEMPFGQVFADFVQAVALNGEAGVPEELSFDTLDLIETYVDRDGEEFVLDGLQGIAEVTLPGTLVADVVTEPWGAVFYRATGGDGNELLFKAKGIDSLLTRIYEYGSKDL